MAMSMGATRGADEGRCNMEERDDAQHRREDQPHDVPAPGADGDRDTVTRGNNEDKKIFVGGIAYTTTDDDLVQYFASFGSVVSAQVKYDFETGRSRGFAFVEFASADACRDAMRQRQQNIHGKDVEVKPAKSRENKKVFVGGLAAEFPEEELRAHFEQYGAVEDIEWPYDRVNNARRQFAFVVFEDEEAADRAAALSKHQFDGFECDVKKAVPQRKRNYAMTGSGGRTGGPMRVTGYGSGGRAANSGGGWYSNGGWGGANPMYGGYGSGNQAYGGGNSTGWSDLYATAAANNAAYNYYGQMNSAAGYGGYGGMSGNTGYDYGNGGSQQQRYPRQY